MSPSLATLVYAIGIAGLFFLDRDRSVRTSKALWLPVIWLWIVGSRPVSVWLGITSAYATKIQLDNPVDELVYLVLVAASLMVIVRRGAKVVAILRENWPILSYFAFCLVSILWSDFPGVALKRWIKAIGDLAIVLIIVTEPDLKGTLKRVVSRAGFVLLPASVLLIKYFPYVGRGYSPWTGTMWNTGVTTDKNMLGVIVFVLTLGTLWNFLTVLRSKTQPNRGRHLLAQATLLIFGLALLKMADSVTSLASFVLGAGLLLLAGWSAIKRRPRAVHAVVLTIILAAGLTVLLGGEGSIVRAMGRKPDLTGRTQIWAALIPMAPNSVVGAGFESFWLGPRLKQARSDFPGLPLNEAHDGYLEVYLNLGWIGVGLIAWILISGYRQAATVFRRNPAFGGLLLSYVAAGAVYNFTEAGFRMLDPNWIFLLVAVVAGSPLVASGVEQVALPRLEDSTEHCIGKFANGAPAPFTREKGVVSLQSSPDIRE